MTVDTVLRLALAAVFAAAGAAKLADLRGSRAALTSFGVPQPAAVWLGVLLPLAELAVAGALVPAASARYAAAAGLALLVVFAGGIGWALLRGRTPDCHCFGRLHSAPVSWKTLARNAGLAVLAALLLVHPAENPGVLDLVALAVGAVVVGQAVLGHTLLRRYGHALQRIAELEAGEHGAKRLEVDEAPAFVLPAVGGGEVSLEGLLARARPVFLVFTDPDCGPCHALLPALARWQHERGADLTVALVSRGGVAENEALAAEHGLETVLLQGNREVAELYGAFATPSALLVGTDGRVAHELAAGATAIEEVLESLARPVPISQTSSNGVAKLAAAAAAAGGLAALAASAEAASGSGSQQPPDPELREIVAILKEHAPRLASTSKRAREAVRTQATLEKSAAQRRRSTAAARALAAERKETLALRTELASLRLESAVAQSVRVLTLQGLALFARSLRKQERALTAAPRTSARLLDQSQDLWLRSWVPFIRAAEALRRG